MIVQLRLILAEYLLQLAFDILPNGKEKILLSKFLLEYFKDTTKNETDK